jgi:LPPG:FO 2-phospho-L-lactate transferase
VTGPRVAVLSGGVGGARFLHGLCAELPARDVTAVVNVGDDFEPYGLHVSPDLDTVLYTLSGLIDDERGWGVAGDSARALEQARRLGDEAWFWLGDVDLGLHLARAALLRSGAPLSSATATLARRLALELRLLPATDDPLRTYVGTDAGELDFQTYFVRRGQRDAVRGVRLDGVATARPAPGVLDALGSADLIVIAPSNPLISIGPILAVPGIRSAVAARRAATVAVSPIVGGRALKGPAAAMLRSLGHEVSPVGVARLYADVCATLVLDEVDDGHAAAVEALGVRAVVTQTVMTGHGGRRRLARAVLEAGGLRCPVAAGP